MAPAGGVAVLLLPATARDDAASTVVGDVRRLTSDRAVAAWWFDPYCCNYSFSNDARLVWPEAAWGRTYTMVGPPGWQRQFGNPVPAGMAVIGGLEPATVTVTVPAGVRLGPDPDEAVGAAGRFDVALGAGEALLMHAVTIDDFFGDTSQHDLTGTRVSATAPVTVIATHPCTYYPHGLQACDHVEDTLAPDAAAQTTWVLHGLAERGAANPEERVYYKVAGPAATELRLTGGVEVSGTGAGASGVSCTAVDGGVWRIPAAGHCELGVRAPTLLTATAAVQVIGIVSGALSTTPGGADVGEMPAGDPSMFRPTPPADWRTDYRVCVPGFYPRRRVRVVAPAGARLTLDGVAVRLAGATAVPGTDYVVEHVALEPGPHRLEADAPFGAVVYGFDRFVSFATSAGFAP